MRADELMIDDWVYETRDNHPERVREIWEHRVMLEYNDLYEYDEIEPAPLTPEILEKNGFRVIFEGELHTSYFQDIERFHTEIKVDKTGIYQKLSMCDGLGNKVVLVECKFVHQLQHVLNLFCINKDIKL